MSLEWIRRAVCRDEDTELFFPIGNSDAYTEQVEEAVAFCRRCPVRGECLSYALSSPQKFGIWGGLTEDERQPVRRKAMRKANAA